MAFGVAFLVIFGILCTVQRNECFSFSGPTNFAVPNSKPNKFGAQKVSKFNLSEKKGLAEKVEEMGRELQKTNARLERQCRAADDKISVLFNMVADSDTTNPLLKFNEAVMSSRYEDNEAVRAIDGNTAPVLAEKSCAHSDKEPEPWWMGTLSERRQIHKVVLTNRQDACRDRMSSISVEVFEKDPTNDPDAEAQVCGKIDKDLQETVNVQCEQPLWGNYVRVIKRSAESDYLTLCEVQAYGETSSKQFTKSIQSSEVAAASLAIDEDPKTCSETENHPDKETWWQVEVPENTTVTGVAITNRDDEKYKFLSDFKVTVHKTFPSVCEDSDDNVCTHHNGTVGQGETVTLTCDRPMSGGFLKITMNGGMLSLCDIRLVQGEGHADSS